MTSAYPPVLHDLYAPIREELAAAADLFDAELVSDLPCVNELCARLQAYRGKMLRPALLLLSARAAGSLAPAHRTLAAVVEMVHVATLVHDDVLDEADERRRQPTIRRTDGNVTAILLGDYLISHAFHLCSGLGDQHASRRIGATTNRVCEGELWQNAARGRDDLSEEDYFAIIERKTGALTAVACELGAHYAGAEEETVRGLQNYGMACGVAFQIVDDVLDLCGNPKEVGKTLAADLSLGKLTLPTLHAVRQADAETAARLRQAVRGEVVLSHDVVRRLLHEAGSFDYALRAARDYVARAVQSLQPLPPSEAKETLTALAEFIVQRRF